MLTKTVRTVMVLAAIIGLTGCGSTHQEAAKTAAIGIEHPLGGMRYLFVSHVDGKAWGIVCPGSVEQYIGKTSDDIRNCGYTEAVGPLPVDDLMRQLPPNIDRYNFERDLRGDALVPVSSSRDTYYAAWEILARVSAGVPGTGPGPCPTSTCPQHPVMLTLDVHSESGTVYIYGTSEPGHFGALELDGVAPTKKIYLNLSNKMVLNLFTGCTTVYIDSKIKDNLLVQNLGGTARYYYF